MRSKCSRLVIFECIIRRFRVDLADVGGEAGRHRNIYDVLNSQGLVSTSQFCYVMSVLVLSIKRRFSVLAI